MATIKSQMTLNDGMSAVLKKITSALDTTLSSFEQVQRASGQAIDVANIQQARAQLAEASRDVDRMADEYQRAAQEEEKLNQGISQGTNAMDGLLGKVTALVGAYMSLSSIKGFVTDSLSAADTQINAQVQLKTVMSNMGSLDYYDQVLQKAADIQSKGIYGDEAMIAGAGELSTYFSDGEALMSMMDTLSNYAMGMSGGGEVDPSAMIDYATGIGKIMTGSYDAMTKKGFEFTDAQKAIIEGTATEAQIVETLGAEYLDCSQEMQAAAAINSVIDESWSGLYETMSNTPEGQIIQFNNTLGDLKEEIGAGLYPAVLNFISVFQENLPMIQEMARGFAQVIGEIIDGITWAANVALEFAGFVQDNWSIIAPIVYGIAAAFVVYKAVTLAQAAAQWVLNAALNANPLMWIATLIGVVIAAIATWVDKVGGLTNAMNICKAALQVAFNAIKVAWNAVVYGVTWGINKILDFVDNLKLCWQRAGVAIANFMGDMKVSVLTILQNLINGAIDIINKFIGVLNKIPGVSIGTIDHLTFATEAAAENEANRQAREAELAAYEADIAAGKAEREANLQAAKNNLDNAVADLSASATELADLYAASKAGAGDQTTGTIDGFTDQAMGAGGFALDDMAGDVGDIAKNTGKSADSLDITSEELKYLRDIAERDAINRFTTAEVKIDMTGMTNKIDSSMDLDGVIRELTDGFTEALVTAAEGVHA